jgi:hypothetical protein
MSVVGLAIYSIKVQKFLVDQPLIIDAFSDGVDLLSVFEDYFNLKSGNLKTIEQSNQVFRVRNSYTAAREISGIIEKGNYGSETSIIDVTNGNDSYKKKVQDADMIPFYFLASLPKGSNIGIFGIQMVGVHGCKSEFEEDFLRYFHEFYPDFQITFHRLVTDQIIEKYLKRGIVKKIRLVNYIVPTDIADAYSTGLTSEEIETEFIISAKTKKSLKVKDNIRRILRGEIGVNQIVEIQEKHYDSVKVVLSIGGSKNVTIDLSDTDTIKSRFDVDNVIIGDDGNPQFQSIDKESKSLVKGFFDALNI